MRAKVLLALLLSTGLAQAQVVSPLGGSTSTPQGRPPATAPAPAPSSRITMPSTTAAPATAAAPATSVAPSTGAAPPTTTAAPRRARRSMDERFAAANATHDGKLTLEQARAGRLRAVARDFDQIDTTKRGYVTLDEIKAHQSAQRAAHRAARAAKPAAQ